MHPCLSCSSQLKMHGFKQHGRPWAGHYFFKGPHGFYATLNPKARYLDISKGDRSVHNDYAWTSLVRFFAKQGIKKIDEGKLNEEKYVVASVYGDLYTPKAVSRNVADKLMMKLAKQYAGDNVFVLGVKYWNKPHKYNKKKIMAKEGNITEASPIEKSYKAIMELEKSILKLEQTFKKEKSGMVRDRAYNMAKSIQKLKLCWNNLYADTQSS